MIDATGQMFLQCPDDENSGDILPLENLELSIDLNHTQITSRFHESQFVVAVANLQLNTVSLRFITGTYRDVWKVESVEYSLPVRPERVTRITLAVAPSFTTVAVAISYQLPKFSEIMFVNIDNGVHISSSLRGAECPISNPTEREAARFAVKSCSFSADGRLLFGCNDNGSIFAMLTCGALVPMKIAGDFDGNADFLQVQPLKISHDDLMRKSKVMHSLFSSQVDPILSFSDGYVVHLLKYPKLDVTNPGFSNPFLMQLINSGHDLLNAVKSGGEKTTLMKTFR